MSVRSKINGLLKSFEKPFDTYNEITVSRSAILHNFDFFTQLLGSNNIIPVLKSNAYGHGLKEVTKILKDRKFPYIAVDGFFESSAIHEISRQPVLLMGAIKPQNYARMSFKGVAFVVHDEETVRALGSTGRRAKVHIEVDTGMTRHGVPMQKLPEFLVLLAKYPNLDIEGVMSHLADADSPKGQDFSDQQTQLFDHAVELIREKGLNPTYLHIAQSAGSVKVSSKYANALRIGLSLYGINPLERNDPNFEELAALKPALNLTSTITKVHHVQPGTTVSYNRAFTAKKASRIGVVPFGYFEGLPRILNNKGHISFGSEKLPITGKICMNHTMLNLTDSNAKSGDQVTIISPDPQSESSIAKLCETYGLFNYGLLIGLNQRTRRRIVA